jgi:hypothetical protein
MASLVACVLAMYSASIVDKAIDATSKHCEEKSLIGNHTKSREEEIGEKGSMQLSY